MEGAGWAGAKSLGASGFATGNGFLGRLAKGAAGFVSGLFMNDARAHGAAVGNALGYGYTAPLLGHNMAEAAGAAAGGVGYKVGKFHDTWQKTQKEYRERNQPRIGQYKGFKQPESRKTTMKASKHAVEMGTKLKAPVIAAAMAPPGFNGVTKRQWEGYKRKPDPQDEASYNKRKTEIHEKKSGYKNNAQLHSALDRIGNTQRRKMFGFGKRSRPIRRKRRIPKQDLDF